MPNHHPASQNETPSQGAYYKYGSYSVQENWLTAGLSFNVTKN